MRTNRFGFGLVVFVLFSHAVFAQSGDEIEQARQVFTPDLTGAVLVGDVPAPEGFDRKMAERIGDERLKEIRLSKQVEGRENDLAALVLMQLGADPERLKIERPENLAQGPPNEQMKVEYTGAEYKVAQQQPTGGFFKTGQEADIVLSAIDFNDTGGPLLFNHPAGIATDDTHFLLSDRNNNRVLIWNKLPTDNTPPDLVLGQPDFTSNNPGTLPHQMNWPSAVSARRGRVAVADTNNARILVWFSVPTRNHQPADLVIELHELGRVLSAGNLEWPWGVWTNGDKLIAGITHGSVILIWNQFPIRNTDLPLVLSHSDFGTPRYMTSDGNSLIVWDHNAKNYGGSGTFFWRRMPTQGHTPYDFSVPYQAVGDFTSRGQLLLIGRDGAGVHIWDRFPTSENDEPDLVVGSIAGGPDDGSSVAIAGDKIYILRGNDNRIYGFLNVPTDIDQKPDFVIGSDRIDINPLTEKFFITNPVPASNGKNIFVSSDFDRKLYVWKHVPDESGAYPDIVYTLPFAPWQNALWKNTFVIAGESTVYIWRSLPLAGEKPDLILSSQIGSVSLQNIRGVTLDDRYVYLADDQAGKVYVWSGIPSASSEPLLTLDTGVPTGRIYSSGEYLLVLKSHGGIQIHKIAELGKSSPQIVKGGPNFAFNMPGGAILIGNQLVVADTGFGRVLGWNHFADAVAGGNPTFILGATTEDDHSQEIGRDKLFWPAALSYDGRFLWVGEFKFSGRLLRFGLR